jgi:hypothetical protein
MSERLDDWKDRQPLSAAHLQQPVDLLRKLAALPGFGLFFEGGDPGDLLFELRMGKIVAAGPNGEADYPDERYWVREQYIQGGATTAAPVVLADENPWDPGNSDDQLLVPVEHWDEEVPAILTVTNLPELTDHTHALPAGLPVVYFAAYDRGDPPRTRLVMFMGGAEEGPEFYGQVKMAVANLTWGASLLPLVNITPG